MRTPLCKSFLHPIKIYKFLFESNCYSKILSSFISINIYRTTIETIEKIFHQSFAIWIRINCNYLVAYKILFLFQLGFYWLIGLKRNFFAMELLEDRRIARKTYNFWISNIFSYRNLNFSCCVSKLEQQ